MICEIGQFWQDASGQLYACAATNTWNAIPWWMLALVAALRVLVVVGGTALVFWAIYEMEKSR